MCGFAGIYFKNCGDSFDSFIKSAQLISHRGPDYRGIWKNDRLCLVHYRLSIIDTDSRSNQPFLDEDKVIAYNGEIYNYKDLSNKYNLQLDTTSDTEVLIKLLQNDQANYREFNGIYAFAIYDQVEKNLKLCRDRLGVKPLYYFQNNDFIIFSSEAKVIYDYIDEISLNDRSIFEFFRYGNPVNSETAVKGVNKLDPGIELVCDSNFNISFNDKCSVHYSSNNTNKSENLDQVVSTLQSKIDKAIERQCVSDVPVGVFLSGGVDSSTVTAFASKYIPNLNTYSVDFEGGRQSELKLARKIAKQFGTNHHEYTLTSSQFRDSVDQIIIQYDQPFSDPAFLPLHILSKECSSKSKVVLQGDGGDELFCGYRRHLDYAQLSKRRLAFFILSKLTKNPHWKERNRVLNSSTNGIRMGRMVSFTSKMDIHKVFKSDFFANHFNQVNEYQSYEEFDRYLGNDIDKLQKMSYTDLRLTLDHTFLEKVDKVTMYNSVEARVPLLENELFDYVTQLPSYFKVHRGIPKYLLKKAMDDILPKEILWGKKNAFGTPIHNWMKTGLKDKFIATFEDSTNDYPFLNLDFILEEFKRGKFDTAVSAGLLWRVYVFVTWMNHYKAKIKL